MSSRVILVTGGNGALGQAIASVFLAESPDNSVWLGVHHNRDRAEKLASQYPGQACVLPLDVADPASWKSAVGQLLARTERLDVLVNNAGFHEDGLLATLPSDSWERVRAVNLDGTFHGCQAVLPSMISQRSGRIVNIASLSALLPPPGQTNYAAAKAGVVALTQSLAKEIARLGITVNAVCPGYIDTGSLDTLTDEARRAALARIPMRRFGQPAEVAAAVRFLACREAAYVTGSVLKIDGGIL